MTATLEAVPLEAEPLAVPVEAGPRQASGSPATTTITNISQLPSIWSLEQNIEWLIDGIIPLGSITLLSGESGGGKTWLAYAIAGTVARGESFASLKVQQRPVLYLDGENPLCLAKQRLFDLGIPETPDLRVWGGWLGDPPPGPHNPIIMEYSRQHRPLLIWDSLIDFHDGDEQSASDTRAFMKHFRALANLGATVLVLHHTGKTATSQDYRGSSDIKAAVDMAYCVEPEFTLDGCIHRLTMRNFKSRLAPRRHLGLEFVPRKGFISCEVPDQPRDAMQTIVEIVKAHTGSNQSQIVTLAQAAGIGKHQVEKCLKDAAFHRERGTGKEFIYTIAQADRTPVIPVPIEREYGISTVPAEEVA
jgi:hypothetical protein